MGVLVEAYNVRNLLVGKVFVVNRHYKVYHIFRVDPGHELVPVVFGNLRQDLLELDYHILHDLDSHVGGTGHFHETDNILFLGLPEERGKGKKGKQQNRDTLFHQITPGKELARE